MVYDFDRLSEISRNRGQSGDVPDDAVTEPQSLPKSLHPPTIPDQHIGPYIIPISAIRFWDCFLGRRWIVRDLAGSMTICRRS